METATVPTEALQAPRVQQQLARSALYELLALALAYPEAMTLDRSAVLAEDLAAHSLVTEYEIAAALERYRAASDVVDPKLLAPCFFALFEGEVLCSPHETEYLPDPFAKPPGLADIAGFYRAFGLKVSPERRASPDNISTELEFMAMLARKRAYALVRGWDEEAEVARDADRSFLEDHLGRWAETFTEDLCEKSHDVSQVRPEAAQYYHAVAELLRESVVAELASARIHPSKLQQRRVRPGDVESFECPFAAPGDEPTVGMGPPTI